MAFYQIASLLNAEFYYQPSFIPSRQTSDLYLQLLNQTPFNLDNHSKREAIFYSIDPDKPYIYQDRLIPSLLFEDQMEILRLNVSKAVSAIPGYENTIYDTCLVNYYPNGEATIAPHCDKETILIFNKPIASLSLGADRNFDLYLKPLNDNRGHVSYSPDYTLIDYEFDVSTNQDPFGSWIKPRTHWRYRMTLHSGSLLVMGKNSQKNYLHGIPEQTSIKEGRLNLTFRVTSNQ